MNAAQLKTTEKDDSNQRAYSALEDLLKRIRERKLTGEHAVLVCSNQGTITRIRIRPEEAY